MKNKAGFASTKAALRMSLLLCLMVGLAAALYFIFRPDHDPIYEGRPLSQHLAYFHGFGIRLMTRQELLPEPYYTGWGEAEEAIMAVGTNALPMLARMLGDSDTSFERLTFWLHAKYPQSRQWLKRTRPVGYTRQMRALVAFKHLGPAARPVVSRITPLLRDPDTALVAAIALMYIKPQREADILSLTNMLNLSRGRGSTSAHMLHTESLLVLSSFGTKAGSAVPSILPLLSATNRLVRGAAALALAKIGAPPKVVLPVLLRTMETNRALLYTAKPSPTFAIGQQMFLEEEMRMSIQALVEYGHHARDALPILSNLAGLNIASLQTEEALKKIHAAIESGGH